MVDQTHNIGIIAHIDAGKTTLTERILYISGKTHKIGEVDSGTTQMDWMEQEQNRGITINSACTTIAWKQHIINIIDTPGHVDFTIEVERSLRVLDAAIGVFCAVSGVEPQSETVWHQAEHYHVSRIAYINKLDRLGADFYAVLDDIQKKLHVTPLPLTLPIGSERTFEGIIDLMMMKELLWNPDSQGLEYKAGEIRDSYREEAEKWHQRLREKVIEYSDALTEKYLNEETIESSEILAALKEAVIDHALLPVFCGSSLQNIGIQPILDAVCTFFPTPSEVPSPILHVLDAPGTQIPLTEYKGQLMGFVFKSTVDRELGLMHYVRIYKGTLSLGMVVVDVSTGKKERVLRILKVHANKFTQCDTLHAGEIAVLIGPKSFRTGHSFSEKPQNTYALEGIEVMEPVISSTLETKTLHERDKLLEVLQKLAIEDPSFHYKEEESTGQLLISGMGELHLEVLTTKIQNDYKLPVRQGHPMVNYRESIEHAYREKHEIHKIPGHSDAKLYAMIELEMSPLETEKNTITVGVPEDAQLFLAPVRQSIENSLKSGIVLGYPLVNTHVNIIAITYEGEVSNADIVLNYAATQAFSACARQAGPLCMEPSMKLIITVPDEFLGPATQIVNAQHGIIRNISNKGVLSSIEAEAVLSKLFGFSTALRNVSEGRGRFSMEFLRYVPKLPS